MYAVAIAEIGPDPEPDEANGGRGAFTAAADRDRSDDVSVKRRRWGRTQAGEELASAARPWLKWSPAVSCLAARWANQVDRGRQCL